MRLTLRTLLAYLDDTLKKSDRQVIARKLTRSGPAKTLVARIRQFTGRRQLTTPPDAGLGQCFDANTIAEYLDNLLLPDQVVAIEKLCLESESHLDEITACHQILAQVQDKLPTVPPDVKQRTCALADLRNKTDGKPAERVAVASGLIAPASAKKIPPVPASPGASNVLVPDQEHSSVPTDTTAPGVADSDQEDSPVLTDANAPNVPDSEPESLPVPAGLEHDAMADGDQSPEMAPLAAEPRRPVRRKAMLLKAVAGIALVGIVVAAYFLWPGQDSASGLGSNQVVNRDSGQADSGPTIEGNFEIADSRGIIGWAWDKVRPDVHLSVEIYDGETRLVILSANRFRPDLLHGGKGDGKHGFDFALPDSLKDGRRHTVHAKIAGRNFELKGSPKKLQVSR